MGSRFLVSLAKMLVAAALSAAGLPSLATNHAAPAAFKYPVIVIPGIMGSRLEKNGQVLWGDSIWTMKGRFEQLALPDDLADDGVRPAGPINELRVVGGLYKIKQYTELIDHLRAAGLEEGRTLFVFSYDWRRSSADAANKLEQKIKEWSAAIGQPRIKFNIVAHSMGGLVAKYYINRLGGEDRIDRLILVGTPTGGSLKSLMMIRGGLLDDEVNDFLGEAKVRRVVRSFPSTYELLPRVAECCLAPTGETLNIFSVEPWRRYGWIEFTPQEAPAGWKIVEQRLRDAQDFHHALFGVGSKPVTILKIVGYTQSTLERIVAPASGRELAQHWGSGDGTVTVESARRGDMRANDRILNLQIVGEKHGSLYADAVAKASIVDLLLYRAGKETQYSTTFSTKYEFGKADVSLDRPHYAPGANALLTVQLLDADGKALQPESITFRLAGAPQAMAAGQPGAYRFQAPARAGTYELQVTVKPPGQPALSVTEIFEVVAR